MDCIPKLMARFSEKRSRFCHPFITSGLLVFAGVQCAPVMVAQGAAIRLGPMFSEHMVIQQEMPVVVTGWTDAAEDVVVEFATKSAGAKAGADGSWRVVLPAMKADGVAHTLTVRGKTVVELKDVWLGEVWVGAGQSNMGQPVSGEDAKLANLPGLRLFNSSGDTPRLAGMDAVSGWVVCTPESILTCGDGEVKRRAFSEVGYHFGRRLHESLKVPVGIIQQNCGGSTAKDWCPPPADVLAKMPWDQKIQGITHKHGLLYQVRMPGLFPFPVRGVFWYQGEDDGRNAAYAHDLKTVIESWRTGWGRPELSFYLAQIAQTTYSGGMLGVWTAQQQVMKAMPHTAIAPSNDIYDDTKNNGYKLRADPVTGWMIAGGGNPHPTGRPLIARRLADIALVQTYARPPAPVLAPMYDSHEVRDGKIRVRFQNAYAGLQAADDKALTWFEISDGTDYVRAQARIVSADTIEVSSEAVKLPKQVRFSWHTLARHNLVNSGRLPALPFRTESLPEKDCK
ncbi:MAG: hypothetical protein EXS33_07350 [Pedosphaera sp.]|nr:hypothetical protein [Pedosphaera sp.]